jgi:hypothetical protein
MRDVLFEYSMNPTTWVYVSSLMIVGIYFKFYRVFSVRNLDLAGLIAMAPGLRLVARDDEQLVYLGCAWLFVVGGFFLVRLLVDPIMVRRPLLEPNLSAAGLTFTGASLLVFLLANVVTQPPAHDEPQRLEQILAEKEISADRVPGYPPFYRFAGFTNRAFIPPREGEAETVRRAEIELAAARTTAILGHLALVLGLMMVGYRHFDNVQTGVAAAALYLLLPYTAEMTSRVDHVLPAALLVWAVAAYRRPMIAGALVGLAGGAIYYPLFLLPLWCGFYWHRGLFRFLGAVAVVLALMAGPLLMASESSLPQLGQMFGVRNPLEAPLSGFWEHHEPAFRIPVMVAFAALCVSMALWPPQKNLGTLISGSAAIMLATQFWHANYGGIYIAWYLPLLILTIFRPNLEDRVARSAVIERPGWWRRLWASRAKAAA